MRGIYTPVTDIRRKVFTEVARMAYNANELSDYAQLMRELPFKIIPGEEKSLRSSIFLERAIVSERIRLAMGFSLRPLDESVPATGTEIAGKNAVVIGRSNIVGKPAALLLLAKNATVTICHSKTKNLKEVCAAADILVAAVGREGFVTGDMVKPGAVVIDVGINRGADGKLHGDVNFAEAGEKAGYITPVPGGVGPMTRAMLMLNTVEAAARQSGKTL